jgi:hypothetical protein
VSGKLHAPDISCSLDAAYGVTIEDNILGGDDGFRRQFNSVQSKWDRKELCRQLPGFKLLDAYTSMLKLIYFREGALEASNYCHFKEPRYAGKALEDDDIVEFIHSLNPLFKINVTVEYLKKYFMKGRACFGDRWDDIGHDHPNIDVAGLCHEMKERFRYVEICAKKGLKTLAPNLQERMYHLRSRNIPYLDQS